jgi:hypothetical protein
MGTMSERDRLVSLDLHPQVLSANLPLRKGTMYYYPIRLYHVLACIHLCIFVLSCLL